MTSWDWDSDELRVPEGDLEAFITDAGRQGRPDVIFWSMQRLADRHRKLGMQAASARKASGHIRLANEYAALAETAAFVCQRRGIDVLESDYARPGKVTAR